MERKIDDIDYNSRLDKELQQYILKVQEIADNDAGTDLTKIRASYDRVCNTFKVDISPEVKIQTNSFNTKEKQFN